MREAPAEAGPKSRLAPARGRGLTALRVANVLKPQFIVSLVCHCEELCDAAISIKDRYLFNEIVALPLAMTALGGTER